MQFIILSVVVCLLLHQVASQYYVYYFYPVDNPSQSRRGMRELIVLTSFLFLMMRVFRLQSDRIEIVNPTTTPTPTPATTPAPTSAPTTAPGCGITGGGMNATCITTCGGLTNGDYQSCVSCNVYASCANGIFFDNRPCAPATPPLVWDDNTKRCECRSNTCFL